jgi:predicted transcriptional regulator
MRSFREKQRAILWCLHRSPEGLLTRSISKITGIWMIAVYTHLGQLEEAGLIRWEHRDGETGPALWKVALR